MCSQGHKGKAVYELKHDHTKFARHRGAYNETNFKVLTENCRPLLRFYGYTGEDTDSPTNFFEYDQTL